MPISMMTELQAEHGAEQRERHGDHDDDRMHEALELRGQHEVDDGEREQEREVELLARARELARLAVPRERRLGR
jgi:hypothetical protein